MYFPFQLSVFLDTESHRLGIDLPALRVSAGAAEHELVSEDVSGNRFLIILHDLLELLIALRIDLDAVHDLESGFLAHCLDLGYQFTHKTFLKEFRGEMLIQNDGDSAVGLCLKAL